MSGVAWSLYYSTLVMLPFHDENLFWFAKRLPFVMPRHYAWSRLANENWTLVLLLSGKLAPRRFSFLLRHGLPL